MNALRKTSIVVSAALIVAAVGLGAASARADDAVPDDVVAQYTTDAAERLRDAGESQVDVESDDGASPDFASASAFGAIHRLYAWSPAFIDGTSSDRPVSAMDEWLAPVLDDRGETVGTYRVWRPSSGSRAEMAGYDDDRELARELQHMASSALLVEDPMSGGWFVVDGETISAANDIASLEVPSPASAEDVMILIAERYAEAIAAGAGQPDSVGGGGPRGVGESSAPPLDVVAFGAGALLALAGAAGLIVVVRTVRGRATSRM